MNGTPSPELTERLREFSRHRAEAMAAARARIAGLRAAADEAARTASTPELLNALAGELRSGRLGPEGERLQREIDDRGITLGQAIADPDLHELAAGASRTIAARAAALRAQQNADAQPDGAAPDDEDVFRGLYGDR